MNQRRGQGQGRPQQQLTPNQQISQDQRARAQDQDQQRLMNELLQEVSRRKAHIDALLPSNVPFAKFQACLAMAIRRDPSLLFCYLPSVIKAAIQSAYDGLMPDGKEAVLVVRNVNIKKRKNDPDEWRKEAGYMPMAYGIRKKIVEAGGALAVETVVVYDKEPFKVYRGTSPRIEHEPIVDSERRGKWCAVYMYAQVAPGVVVFEVMTKGEVDEVRACAQTDTIWKKWETEMARKSVLRRGAKSLPTKTAIRDAEAEILFPQFAGNQPQLPAPAGSAPPPPAREQFAQLGHEQGLPLDLGGLDDGRQPFEEEVERGEEDQPRQTRRKQAKADPEPEQVDDRADQGDQGGGGDPPAEEEDLEPALPRPEDPAGWQAWQQQVILLIGQAKKVEDLDRLQKREQANIAAAPQRNSGPVNNSFIDKRVDLQEQADD